MREKSQVLRMVVLIALGSGCLVGPADAAEVPWEPSLEQARIRAGESGRMVLVHFWADWCSPCKVMDREVFNQPAVIAATGANYVCVKINTDHRPATAQQFNITARPTDVIISPQGQEIARFVGGVPAGEYVGRLNAVAADVRRQQTTGVLARQTYPPASRPQAGAPYQPSVNGAGYPQDASYSPPPATAPTQPVYGRNSLPSAGNGTQPQGLLGDAGSSRRQAAGTPRWDVSGRTTPAAKNPLAVDGCCVVQLWNDMSNPQLSTTQRRWVPGDERWGVIHRGRTYLFSSPEKADAFYKDADRFAPVLSGGDVVAKTDQRQSVAGLRQFGAFYQQQIYLFANAGNLQRFEQNPARYANTALQAMRRAYHRPLHGQRPTPGGTGRALY